MVEGTLSGLVEEGSDDETGKSDMPVQSGNGKAKMKVGFAPGGGLPAVPGNLVEKIREGIYVDFASLLPENMAEQFKDEKEKKKKPIPVETFPDWALSFALYAATVVAEKPEKALELFTYLGVVTRLARDANFGETHWLEYDIQFREKAAALCGEVKWAAVG